MWTGRTVFLLQSSKGIPIFIDEDIRKPCIMKFQEAWFEQKPFCSFQALNIFNFEKCRTEKESFEIVPLSATPLKDLRGKTGTFVIQVHVISIDEKKSWQNQHNQGTFCSTIVADETGSVAITMWNKRAHEWCAVAQPGHVFKLVGVYVKVPEKNQMNEGTYFKMSASDIAPFFFWKVDKQMIFNDKRLDILQSIERSLQEIIQRNNPDERHTTKTLNVVRATAKSINGANALELQVKDASTASEAFPLTIYNAENYIEVRQNGLIDEPQRLFQIRLTYVKCVLKTLGFVFWTTSQTKILYIQTVETSPERNYSNCSKTQTPGTTTPTNPSILSNWNDM